MSALPPPNGMLPSNPSYDLDNPDDLNAFNDDYVLLPRQTPSTRAKNHAYVAAAAAVATFFLTGALALTQGHSGLSDAERNTLIGALALNTLILAVVKFYKAYVSQS